MKTKNNQDNLAVNKKRLESADENFRKLMHEIKPFIKESRILLDTTEGKWQVTGLVHNNQFNKPTPGC